MALTPAELQELNGRIGWLLDKHLAPIFKSGTQLTFIARSPGNDEADVLVTTERDLNDVIAVALRSLGRAAVGAGVDAVPRTSDSQACPKCGADSSREHAEGCAMDGSHYLGRNPEPGEVTVTDKPAPGEGAGRGCFRCPICGKDSPHHHSDDEVQRHREEGLRDREDAFELLDYEVKDANELLRIMFPHLQPDNLRTEAGFVNVRKVQTLWDERRAACGVPPSSGGRQ